MEEKTKSTGKFSPKKVQILGHEVPVRYFRTKDIVNEQFQSIDDGLTVDFIQVPLTCVYTLKRMEMPCRTTDCKHVQCFDASAMFQKERFGKEKQLKTCPICGKQAKNFYVDGYMRSVLQQTSSDKDIQIYSDCTWAGTKDPDEDKPEKDNSDDVIDLTNDTIIDLTELDITIEEIDKTIRT